MEKFENLIYDMNKNILQITKINGLVFDNIDLIFENIEFNKIEFKNSEIVITGNKCPSKKILLRSDSDSLNFKNCSFTEELKFDGFLNRNIKFNNCNFTDITLINIQKNNEQIKNEFILKNTKSIKNLTIDSCEFYGKFYINKQDDKNYNEIQIEKLILKNSEFKNNFKLHNCRIGEVEIKDIDFEKNADFYKSKFIKGVDDKDIYFKSINFKGLALFGDTEFFQKLIYKYVTFEGHNHFKSAKLHKGLDLEYTNIQKEINFYGIEILDKNTTSQETYRIIKNQFEKLNNKIEANKYHALELDQRKKELEKNKYKNFAEYLVFKIHDISSKHSTSWFRAVLWIIFIGFFTIFLVHFDIVKDLFFYPSNFKTEYLSKIWNEFWQYINITNLEKLKNKPFIFFFNKVSLGYLYYQCLTAVRKDTRK